MDRFLTVSKAAGFGAGIVSGCLRPLSRGVAASLVVLFALSACSWFHSTPEPSTKGEMRTPEDMPAPKFQKPKFTGEGAPDLASVPSDTPTPPSTKKEREKIIEGLVADRERARYTDQESRIQPVNVRPLTEAAAELDDTDSAPPQAKGAPVSPVTKMHVAPGKAANADDLAKLAANAPPPPPPAVGPAGPEGATPSSSGPRAGGVVRPDGFRELDTYGAKANRHRVTFVDFGVNSTTLTPADERKVDDAAQLGKDKGIFRVIGRSNDASQKSQQRATAVAHELQKAGIPQDRIYVGSDSGNEGLVDVMLDK